MELEKLRRFEELYEIIHKLHLNAKTKGKKRKLLRLYKKRQQKRNSNNPDFIFLAIIFKSNKLEIMEDITTQVKKHPKHFTSRMNLKPSICTGKAKRELLQEFAKKISNNHKKPIWKSPTKSIPLSLNVYMSPSTEIAESKRVKSCGHLQSRKKKQQKPHRKWNLEHMKNLPYQAAPRSLGSLSPLHSMTEEIIYAPKKICESIEEPLARPVIDLRNYERNNKNPKNLLSPSNQKVKKRNVDISNKVFPTRELPKSPQCISARKEMDNSNVFDRLSKTKAPKYRSRTLYMKNRRPHEKQLSKTKQKRLFQRLHDENLTIHRKKLVQQKLEKKTKMKREIEDCSFKPHILSRPILNDLNVHDRLYMSGMVQMHKRGNPSLSESRPEPDLTFHPKTNESKNTRNSRFNVYQRLYRDGTVNKARRLELLKDDFTPDLSFQPKINEETFYRNQRPNVYRRLYDQKIVYKQR